MHSAINRYGALQSDGKAAALSGPIGWDAGELRADFWVRIVQGDVVAEGRSTSGKFKRKHDRWDVVAKVTTGGTLTPGPAYAEYWAKVEKGDGSAANEYWPVWPVRLRQ